MTQLRSDREAISNYFDRLMRCTGRRGSTFTDLDGVTHDRDTDRFLIQEFKGEHERIPGAQRLTLCALAAVSPRCTVWICRRIPPHEIAWEQIGRNDCRQLLTEAEYTARVRQWWNGRDDWVNEALDSDLVDVPF